MAPENPIPESANVNITSKTSNPNAAQNNIFFQFVDACSLSGAIILIFFSLTAFGVLTNNAEVWHNFGTALTTFVSGKQLGKYESSSK
jgi:hypothetical protein